MQVIVLRIINHGLVSCHLHDKYHANDKRSWCAKPNRALDAKCDIKTPPYICGKDFRKTGFRGR